MSGASMRTAVALTPAVVIGLDCITGLQTARTLARHDIPVIGIAANPRHPCARTRTVQRLVHSPTSGSALLEALAQLRQAVPDGAVLYPCTDAGVLTLARGRDELAACYRLMLPDVRVVELLMDKLRFYEFAVQQGLPVPVTRILRTRADVLEAAHEVPFPCILKPALKTPLWDHHSPSKVHRAGTPAELVVLWDRYAPFADGLMVQQWIDGSDAELYSCNCYYDRASQPLATFVARKLRQWPPHTGTSCLGEECRNDTVLDLTLRTFGAAGYHGLGYLEVKRDASSGAHYIIEANVGRPTGRSAIAEAGNVELVYAMYCDALHLPLPSSLEQRYTGAKWIYWRQDIRSAFYYWRRRELSLRDWVASWRGRKTAAVLSWRDPLPFVLDLVSMPARLRGRRRQEGADESTSESPGAIDSRVLRQAPAVRTPRTAAAGSEPCRVLTSSDSVDFDVAGVVSVRAVGASAANLRALERQLGSPQSGLADDPDIVLRFVDRLPRHGLHHVEVGRSAFVGDSYMVRAAGAVNAWAHIPFADAGHRCEFVCERGVAMVPLLKQFVRLSALARGFLPFHASAFEWQGLGVLVAGWSHGGKTSALLAFGMHGARYLGDDLVFISADGSVMRGMAAPISLSGWHLSQRPDLREFTSYRQRALAAATLHLERTANAVTRTGSSAVAVPLRAAARAAQQRSRVVLPIGRIFPAGSVATTAPDRLFLMLSSDQDGVSVEPVASRTVAHRMRHSLIAEAMPLQAHYQAYRYAAVGSANRLIECMATQEESLLENALSRTEAFLVHHPFPAQFGELFQAMRRPCEERMPPRGSGKRRVRA
jgi:D-aspartate ligase